MRLGHLWQGVSYSARIPAVRTTSPQRPRGSRPPCRCPFRSAVAGPVAGIVKPGDESRPRGKPHPRRRPTGMPISPCAAVAGQESRVAGAWRHHADRRGSSHAEIAELPGVIAVQFFREKRGAILKRAPVGINPRHFAEIGQADIQHARMVQFIGLHHT